MDEIDVQPGPSRPRGRPRGSTNKKRAQETTEPFDGSSFDASGFDFTSAGDLFGNVDQETGPFGSFAKRGRGRPRGSKNKPGHKAGRPKKNASPPAEGDPSESAPKRPRSAPVPARSLPPIAPLNGQDNDQNMQQANPEGLQRYLQQHFDSSSFSFVNLPDHEKSDSILGHSQAIAGDIPVDPALHTSPRHVPSNQQAFAHLREQLQLERDRSVSFALNATSMAMPGLSIAAALPRPNRHEVSFNLEPHMSPPRSFASYLTSAPIIPHQQVIPGAPFESPVTHTQPHVPQPAVTRPLTPPREPEPQPLPPPPVPLAKVDKGKGKAREIELEPAPTVAKRVKITQSDALLNGSQSMEALLKRLIPAQGAGQNGSAPNLAGPFQLVDVDGNHKLDGPLPAVDLESAPGPVYVFIANYGRGGSGASAGAAPVATAETKLLPGWKLSHPLTAEGKTRVRGPRRCGQCSSHDCPGRGARTLCPQYGKEDPVKMPRMRGRSRMTRAALLQSAEAGQAELEREQQEGDEAREEGEDASQADDYRAPGADATTRRGETSDGRGEQINDTENDASRHVPTPTAPFDPSVLAAIAEKLYDHLPGAAATASSEGISS